MCNSCAAVLELNSLLLVCWFIVVGGLLVVLLLCFVFFFFFANARNCFIPSPSFLGLGSGTHKSLCYVLSECVT